MWEQILEMPDPGEAAPHARAMWRYGRGRALAATGDLEGAEAELAALRAAAEDPSLADLRLEFNRAQDVLSVGVHVLAGRIAAGRGNLDRAVTELREAARREDALLYGEPPEWTVPVRHELGEVLLAADRPAEAEAAFRADLERFPANGWSLKGLELALRAQGRDEEADRVAREFEDAWAHADVPIGEVFAAP